MSHSFPTRRSSDLDQIQIYFCDDDLVSEPELALVDILKFILGKPQVCTAHYIVRFKPTSLKKRRIFINQAPAYTLSLSEAISFVRFINAPYSADLLSQMLKYQAAIDWIYFL